MNEETTYKATIDIDVEGEEKLDVLNRTVSTSIGEFDNLNEAISKTQDALGKLDPKKDAEEFETLSKELQDLKDRLRDTEIQSVRFTEALAAQPGVIGLIGGSLEGLRNTIRIFAANPLIAVLAGITGGVLALVEALKRTEEGQAKLNQISQSFTKILNGLFAIIEPIALQLADLAISLLENDKFMGALTKTAGVLSATLGGLLTITTSLTTYIIKNVITTFKTLIGVAGNVGKVLKGVFTFDLGLIKEGVNGVKDVAIEGFNDVVSNVKDTATTIADGVTSAFETGRENFQKGYERLTEEEKKLEEENAKEREEREKERLAQIEEAQKIQTEAYLSLLEDRERELLLREQKFNEEREKLLAAGITDLSTLEEAYREDVQSINDRYDDEAQKKQLEAINQRKELFNQQLEDQKLALETSFTVNEEAFSKELALVNEREKMLLSVEGLTEEQRTQIQNEAAQQRLEIQGRRYEERLNFINEQEQLLLDGINETERILLENENLTQEERNRIISEAESQRLQLEIGFAEQRKGVREAEFNDELLSIETELETIGLTYDRQRELIAEKEALLLEQEGLTQAQRTQIIRQAAAEREAISQTELEARADIQNSYLDLVSQFSSFLSEVAGENKKLQIAAVVAEQAAAIGRIVVNTSVANAKAVAASPLTAGQPWVTINTIQAALGIAASIAAAVKAVREIRSSDSGGGSASSGANLPRGTAAPRPPAPEEVAAPIITAPTTGTSPSQQISETLAASDRRRERREGGRENERPIKTYVVSTEVSSQQALDRRTNDAATFVG